MTVTSTLTAPATRESVQPTGTRTHLGRTGLAAGAVAGVATMGFAAIVRALDVPLTVSGSSIPVVGFGQVTFVAALVGTLIAAVLARRARHPHHTFLVTTLALTAVSFVPDLTADAQTATKVALMLSHIVAAAIVIPALASRLSD